MRNCCDGDNEKLIIDVGNTRFETHYNLSPDLTGFSNQIVIHPKENIPTC